MKPSLRTLAPLPGSLAEYGDKPALVHFLKEDRRSDSFAALADHALRVAHGMKGTGLEKGDRVALFTEVRFEAVAVALGALKAGVVIVPLDMQLSDSVLKTILRDSRPKLVLTDRAHVHRLREIDPGPELMIWEEPEEGGQSRSWRELLAEDKGGSLPEVEPRDQAVLFYTSGTTGPPKGVPLSHANLAFQLQTVARTGLISAGDAALLPLPLHHVYPFVIGLLVPLFLGVAVILPASLTGPQLLRAISEGGATVIVGVPRLYAALFSGIQTKFTSKGRVASTLFTALLHVSLRLRRLGFFPGRLLFGFLHKKIGPGLRMMASGGAPLDPELAWKLEALGWKVAVGYGLTETSPLLTINPPGSGRMNSAGKPIDGVEVRLDTETVPVESRTQGVGELQARGPGVFSGYLNLPEKTREVFTIDGWFRTGDLARRGSGGYIELIGRVSTMIVTQGGENVQPDEVEDAYAESPLILEAGVLQYKGRLTGIIVPDPGELRRSGATDIDAAVRKAVGERSRTMPSYQRLSEFVVSRESLPRTRLGKIKRHLLTERFEQEKRRIEAGKPERKGPMAVEEMADQDRALLVSEEAERTWSWLAGRYPQMRLTPDTSLQLDLGVDSLEWLNITMELRERFGAELDEEAISRIETVRDLLQQVGERAGEGQDGLRVDPLERPEEFLSPEQQQFLQPQGVLLSAMAGGFFRLNRVLLRAAFRVRSSGAERFGNGQVLFAPNHVSYLDPFVLAAVLENRTLEQTYWAGWTGAAFHNPLNRLVSRLAKTVPIDPRGRVAVSMASAAAVLERGRHLVWFPEGRRSPTGKLQPFRPGIGLLLERFDIPVVPVFIKGTDRALPVGRAMPRPSKVTVCFGPPVSGDELDREGSGEERRERITNALHARVAELGKEGE